MKRPFQFMFPSQFDPRCIATAGTGLVTFLMLVGLLCVSTLPAIGLPMFARKYNLPCARCHTMVPRLNRFGYAFYRAGFRLPSNDLKPYTLSNAVSFLAPFSVRNTNPGGNTGFDLDTVEAVLATPISKNLTAHLIYHVATTSGDTSGITEGWLQYNSAPTGSFWSARIGQIPLLDGFQLLGDRFITQTDALLFGSNGPLAGDGQGNFAINGLQRGIEGGYTSGPFSVRASWLNGVDPTGNGAVGLTGRRAQDLALQSDYLIGRDGSALGAFFYLGKTPFPAAMFDNPFQRAGLFGTYARALKGGKAGIPALLFELNGGLLWGEDAVNKSGQRANSFGTLLEADLYLHNRTSLSLRFDNARPSNAAGVPITEAYTASIAHRPNDLIRLGLEYRKQRQSNANSVIGQVWFYY